jgi:uncharacterized RDD family membrane protein YckC
MIVSKKQKPTFFKRILALLIDYAVVLAYMCLLAVGALVLYVISGKLPNWLSHGVVMAELLGFLILVLPVGLYLYFFESSARHATIGKRASGLMVISCNSRSSARAGQIAIRTIVKLLPWEIAHFFVWHTVAATANGQTAFPLWLEVGLVSCLLIPIIYLLTAALQADRRGPHDLVAGTRVTTSTNRL